MGLAMEDTRQRAGSASSNTSTTKAERRKSQSPQASSPEAENSAETDQKAKKRIQNRVAQRTYRNRMKQRVQDLEAQLCEMRARQQQAQFAGAEYPAANMHAEGTLPYPTGANMQHTMWQAAPNMTRTPGVMPNDVWPTMPVDGTHTPNTDVSMQSNAFIPQSFQSHGFPTSGVMSPLNLPGSSGIDNLPHTMMPSDMDMHSPEAMGHPGRGSLDVQSLYKMGHPSEVSEEDANPWDNRSYVMSPTSSRMGAVAASGTASVMSSSPWGSIATAPTEVSEDGLPSKQSTMEERFEYVLDCARKVGFETFDNMASQYYAQNFDTNSSLAMDQRVSRNRHLPAMLADIRQNSGNWSSWERRGFQDETLKTAEEICAAECRDFKANGDAASLATIQQKLPNVWALLTGLATSPGFSRQGDRTNLVYHSIKQLCALEEKATQLVQEAK